ncbi:hypothetical protein EYB25_006316 [Talaromyces marneffei]|uniref:Putative HC-toxin efflux carrier TOXA n=2 Tax=Talaromyces marneffei PM1 TaxID=1077442 RepID=A0A093V079_TALMA|nr:uncharacterized protein EYB26_006390 [Talaromyces marneffei]KAE8552422.1 hypothetical protein EYB25_006316 [Talaromyces marneffei]QGA18705.1 hypothetical protein EYB26_006390 [Talaromyces marneffei]
MSSPTNPPRFDDIELEDGSKSTESAALPSSQEQQPKPSGGPPGGPPQNHEWVEGPKLIFMMTGITLVAFLMLLDTSIISTATPRITSEFHSLNDVGWYGSAYQLASASLQPLTGRFYSTFNTKWTFLAFFFVFEIGSLICAVATSSTMLIVGRAVAGMGGSGIQNGAFTIVAGSVPMPRRPALMGFLMGISQLGMVAGPLVGGALTSYVSWRWCFYINLPVGGLVAVLLVFLKIPEQIPKPKGLKSVSTVLGNLDLIGFTLFAPAAIMFLLALQYGGSTYPWNSATIIGLFVGAGVTFIIFMLWEYRVGDKAMLPYSIFTIRTVWAGCVTYGFLASLLLCGSYYLPIYFQAIKDASPMISGVDILPSIISQMLSAILSGQLLGRIGYYLPLSVLGTSLAAIGNGLVSTFSTTTSTGMWIGYQIILGVGRGIGLQMPIIAVQNTLKLQQVPTAMAMLMFCQSFFSATFLSFADVIFNNSLRTLIPQEAPDVNLEAVIQAGATAFRSVVPAADLQAVLKAYATSIDHVFYLAVGASCAAFLSSWAMGWIDIRKKQGPPGAPGGPAAQKPPSASDRPKTDV